MTHERERPASGADGALRTIGNDTDSASVAADVDASFSRMWRDALAQSKQESRARRARVLAHDDLTKRLAQLMSDPKQWSGWIPPRTLPEDTCTHCARGRRCHGAHRARVNDSPRRAALVEIATEALRREQPSNSDEPV